MWWQSTCLSFTMKQEYSHGSNSEAEFCSWCTLLLARHLSYRTCLSRELVKCLSFNLTVATQVIQVNHPWRQGRETSASSLMNDLHNKLLTQHSPLVVLTLEGCWRECWRISRWALLADLHVFLCFFFPSIKKCTEMFPPSSPPICLPCCPTGLS